MINRTKVEVGLQLSIGTLYLSNQIVIISCGLLIYVLYIGTKEVYAVVLVYVFKYGYALPNVLHVLRIVVHFFCQLRLIHIHLDGIKQQVTIPTFLYRFLCVIQCSRIV